MKNNQQRTNGLLFIVFLCLISLSACNNSQSDRDNNKNITDDNNMNQTESAISHQEDLHKEVDADKEVAVANEVYVEDKTDTEPSDSFEKNDIKEEEKNLQTQLTDAKKSNKAVFLVVTAPNIPDTEKAISLAKDANNIYDNAIVLQMNRNDAANSELIREWQLSDAPLPLILVISPQGMLSGGYLLAQATAQNLAASVPSPKLEKVIKTINNNKYAIAVFSKKSFSDKQEVLKACNGVIAGLNNEAEIIKVDMDDKEELNFMNQFRIDRNSNSSITLIINKQGQIAGMSRGVPDIEKMITAAKTPVRGGCGPGMGPADCAR